MKSFNLDQRTTASLRRRLLAAPVELRAMATAEVADWEAPDFEANKGQMEAMQGLLRACSDARETIFGHPWDNGHDDTDEASDAPLEVRQRVATERLIGLDHAIANGVRAGRLLRQRGIKPTITTTERVNAAGETILARAALGFRWRSVARRAA
jgi:hypothetical protein